MTLSGHTSGAAVVGVTSATTIVAGLAVISRLLTRIAIVRKAGYDDACISISMVRDQMCFMLNPDADISQGSFYSPHDHDERTR
jgi:hypothetical protein